MKHQDNETAKILQRAMLDEIVILRDAIDVCRDLVTTTANIPQEQRRDAYEELLYSVEAYNNIIQGVEH